jgi:hypothetical protein
MVCRRDCILIVAEQLLGGRSYLRSPGWHGDLNPLFARALGAGRIAGRSQTPPTLWAHLRAWGEAGLAEAGDSAIGGVPQHAPDHQAFPGPCPARRIREQTRRTRGISDADGQRTCAYLRGRLGYFDDCQTPSVLRWPLTCGPLGMC